MCLKPLIGCYPGEVAFDLEEYVRLEYEWTEYLKYGILFYYQYLSEQQFYDYLFQYSQSLYSVFVLVQS